MTPMESPSHHVMLSRERRNSRKYTMSAAANRMAETMSRGREIRSLSGKSPSAAISVSVMTGGTKSRAEKTSRPGRRGMPSPAERMSGAVSSSGVSVRKTIEFRRTASRGACAKKRPASSRKPIARSSAPAKKKARPANRYKRFPGAENRAMKAHPADKAISDPVILTLPNTSAFPACSNARSSGYAENSNSGAINK